ncbi:MAG: alpha/beta fold hydrolase [Polyangiaceae bacterium]
MKAPLPSTKVVMDFKDTGAGDPIVFLHAFPFSRLMWRPQVETFREFARVITPDLRGFGGTQGGVGPTTMDAMADDVAALLDAREIREPVTLVGLSMGGYVALAFAAKYAARLRALVLSDTRAEGDDAAAKAKRDEQIALVGEKGTRALVDKLVPAMTSANAEDRASVSAELLAIASIQSPFGIAKALAALRDRPDRTDMLPTVAVPTLVLVGADDTVTPKPFAETLARSIPGAELVEIPRAGHLASLENPKAWNDAVRLFWGRTFPSN